MPNPLSPKKISNSIRCTQVPCSDQPKFAGWLVVLRHAYWAASQGFSKPLCRRGSHNACCFQPPNAADNSCFRFDLPHPRLQKNPGNNAWALYNVADKAVCFGLQHTLRPDNST
eukprot:EG_transcript_43816